MKSIYLLFFVALCMTFASCEDLLVKELDLEEFDYTKQMAISGTLTSESDAFTMLIAENIPITQEFADPQNNAIEGANVSLFKGSELIGNPVKVDGDFFYTLDLSGTDITEGNYSIEVDHPDFPDATASTTIPKEVPLIKIEFEEDAGIAPNFLQNADAVKITFDEPAGEDNYYSFRILTEETILDTFIFQTDTFINEYRPYIDTDISDPNAIAIENGFLLNDNFFAGGETTLTVFLMSYEGELIDLKDDLIIIWEVLSEEKYNFENSLKLYYDSQNFGPFSELVSIYNNIDGGLGVFTGVSRNYYKIP